MTSRRLVRIAVIAAPIAVFIAIVVVMMPGKSAPPPSAAATRVSEAEADAARGIPMPPPDPQTSLLGTDSSLSTTELELVLVATSPGTKPNEGRAALGTDVRNPQTYAAGARLANGAVLKEIYADYVVLSHDGKLSLLTLHGRTPRVKHAHRFLSTDEEATRVGGEAVANAPLERVPSSRVDLSEIIRAEPVYERDEFAGLKIVPGTNRGEIAKLELQSGDIVRSIEGKRVKSADAAWQVLDDAITTRTPVVVTIDRDGTLMSISLDGSRLSEPQVQTSSSGPMPPHPSLQ